MIITRFIKASMISTKLSRVIMMMNMINMLIITSGLDTDKIFVNISSKLSKR